MKAKIKEIEKKISLEIESISLPEHAEKIRVKYLGRKGIITSLLKQVSALPNNQKPVLGKLLNNLKTNVTARINEVCQYQTIKKS